MTTQHTPGPWIYRPAKLDGITDICRANESPTSERSIASAYGSNREANAALIARAPELLAQNAELIAALQRIASGLEFNDFAPHALGKDKPITKAEAVRIARAALAKVTP